MAREIVAPMIAPDIEPFLAPSGNWITSREQHREDLKKSKAIAWEPGIDKDIARNKESELEKAFAPIAAGVDEAVSAMVQTGKLET